MSDIKSINGSGSAGFREESATVFIKEGEQLCARLRELALKKRSLLLAGPGGDECLQDLERLQDEESALFSELHDLVRKERFFVDELTGDAAGEWPSDAAQKLYARYFRLRTAVEELRSINRGNGALLKDLQTYVSSALSLLQRCAEGETYQHPGTKGEVKKVVARRSRLDRQA